MKKTITLTATGRKSGKARAVTLYAYPDDDRLVIVGSRGGSAHDPDWVGNLRADPNATVRVDGKTREVRARAASGSERARLWDLVCEAFPLYRSYQRKTSREFPILVLEGDGTDDRD